MAQAMLSDSDCVWTDSDGSSSSWEEVEAWGRSVDLDDTIKTACSCIDKGDINAAVRMTKGICERLGKAFKSDEDHRRLDYSFYLHQCAGLYKRVGTVWYVRLWSILTRVVINENWRVCHANSISPMRVKLTRYIRDLLGLVPLPWLQRLSKEETLTLPEKLFASLVFRGSWSFHFVFSKLLFEVFCLNLYIFPIIVPFYSIVFIGTVLVNIFESYNNIHSIS